MTLDRNSVEPLYLQLEQHLRHQIERGELAAGDRIPGEQELAEEHKISRMTARRAVDGLVNDGLLVRHPGKGTFVIEDKIPFGIASLNSFSNTMRSMGFTVHSEVVNLEIQSPTARISKNLKLLPDQQVLFLRRIRYVDDEPFALMSSYMPASYYEAMQQADLSQTPLSEVMEKASGLQITTSKDYIEASTARSEEAKLLNVRVGAPVLLGRGIIFESRGMPVRSSKVIYRGDRFRISIAASHATGTELKVPYDETHADRWLALSFNMGD